MRGGVYYGQWKHSGQWKPLFQSVSSSVKSNGQKPLLFVQCMSKSNQLKLHPLVTLYLFQTFQSSIVSVTICWVILTLILQNQPSRDVLLENGPQKAVLHKVFNNEVFLQWSKFSAKAFIFITDLINYSKKKCKVDKSNGLKLTLHF